MILFVYVVEKIGYYDKNKQQIEKIKCKLLFFCVQKYNVIFTQFN